jgi:hypothetical protein
MDPVEIRRRNLIPTTPIPTPRRPASSSRGCRTTPRSTSSGDDAYDGAARRPGGAAQAGRLSRHRLRELHRGDQPEPVLRHRRRAHLRAGRRHGAAGPHRRVVVPCPASPSRARAPRRILAQIVATASACRSTRCGHHRRHRRHALRRRHLGLARRRHRRRGGAAGRPSRCAADILEVAGAMLQATPEPRHRQRRVVDKATGASACRSPSSAASSTSAATRCRRACRASWCRRGTITRGIPLRLHQRHPGELGRGRHRHRLREAAQALVRRGLRHA